MSNYNGKYQPGSENNNWNMAFDLVGENSSVLDIGCSKGDFGEALSFYKKCTVDGVEPDFEDSKAASEKLVNVFNNSVEKAIGTDLKNKKYDHIVLLDVIEHINDPVSVLSELSNNLSPDGSIIFSIPNMAHISVRVMLMGGDFTYGKTGILDNTHLHFYTEKEIQRVFNESGYKISDIDGVIVDYDDNILKNELSEVGVTNLTEDLLKTLDSNNGDVYQFVGKAVIGKESKNVEERPFSSPDAKNNISRFYQSVTEEKQRACKEEINTRDEKIKDIEGDLSIAVTELEEIKSSRTWMVVSKLRNFVKGNNKK
ncbi:MAG: class I SAM-dependent methyltransferase [Candidatus Saccharimonadales bacterium]